MKANDSNLEELTELLSILPQPKVKPTTFLQIAEMPHYENVISNIYAFFLRPNEAHGFGKMFLEALLNAVGAEGVLSEINLESLSVGREVTTDKGNRIDLLVNAGDVSLIIENKIYHHSEYNPFEDYWSHVLNKKKIGIIISLHGTGKNHNEFRSITHREFMHEVVKLLPSYSDSASPKFLIYLHDLFQDIDSLYPMHNPENIEAVKFFIENRDKFIQLSKIQQQADNFKLQAIDQVAKRLQKVSRSTGAGYYRYIDLCSEKGVRLSYEVLMGDLFKTRSFMIRLCSTGETKILHDAYENFKHQALSEGLNESKMPHYENWIYFFEKIYYIEDDNGLDSKLLMFSEALYDVIEKDWASIAGEIGAYLLFKGGSSVTAVS